VHVTKECVQKKIKDKNQMKIQYYKIMLRKPLQVSKELNADINVYYYYYYYYYSFSVIIGSNPKQVTPNTKMP